MNERIKLLALHSKLRPALLLHYWGKIDALTDSEQEELEQLEKFAQLIVKECAKICIEQNVSNLDLDVIRESGKFTLQDLATKSCGENLSNQIKKHFGVEE
jgi:hypothetical protein